MLWETVLVHFDSSVRGFHVGCLEGRLTDYQGKNDNTQRPGVDFIGVSRSTFEHFGSDIVWSSANGPLLLALKIELCRKTEVSELDCHFVIDKEISKLQVSVDNSVGMQILQSINNLHCVAFYLQLMKPLPPLQQLVQALVVAQFKQNIHIFTVFEEVCELSHIHVLDRPVDLDLTHELLFRPASLKRGLLDNLCGRHGLRLTLDELVALREATLAEELALDVLSVADLSIRVLHSLLHNLGTPIGL